jgi:hypothetical protein
MVRPEGGKSGALAPLVPPSFLPAFLRLAQLIPGHRGRMVAPIAGEVPRIAVERLPVAAAGAHRVGEREVPAEALQLTRLAAHQAPPLRGMVADLEEPPVHRHVTPVDVQHDDLAGGNAYDGVPRAPAQEVRAPLTDAGPSPGLEFCGSDGTRWIRHVYIIGNGDARDRDTGHT